MYKCTYLNHSTKKNLSTGSLKKYMLLCVHTITPINVFSYITVNTDKKNYVQLMLLLFIFLFLFFTQFFWTKSVYEVYQ